MGRSNSFPFAITAMTAITRDHGDPGGPPPPVSRSPRLKDLAETSPGTSPDQNSASGNHIVTAGLLSSKNARPVWPGARSCLFSNTKIPLFPSGKFVLDTTKTTYLSSKIVIGVDLFLDCVANVPSGSCEKIGFANFASDLKCIPTSQTSFIGDSEQKFARLNSRQIREIDFFTASSPLASPGLLNPAGAGLPQRRERN